MKDSAGKTEPFETQRSAELGSKEAEGHACWCRSTIGIGVPKTQAFLRKSTDGLLANSLALVDWQAGKNIDVNDFSYSVIADNKQHSCDDITRYLLCWSFDIIDVNVFAASEVLRYLE